MIDGFVHRELSPFTIRGPASRNQVGIEHDFDRITSYGTQNAFHARLAVHVLKTGIFGTTNGHLWIGMKRMACSVFGTHAGLS